MKSIKRGRAPSMMSGVGSIAAAVFGVFWILAAINMEAPVIFPLFGLAFIGMAVSGAVYNFRNATGKTRYSEYDIVEEDEEPDPLNGRFGVQRAESGEPQRREGYSFCPYCGAGIEVDDVYCSKCGKKIV